MTPWAVAVCDAAFAVMGLIVGYRLGRVSALRECLSLIDKHFWPDGKEGTSVQWGPDK